MSDRICYPSLITDQNASGIRRFRQIFHKSDRRKVFQIIKRHSALVFVLLESNEISSAEAASVFVKETINVVSERGLPVGRKDSASRAYFSDPDRFADLVNGICFAGRQVLKGEDLSDVDPHPGKRTRDVVKKASFGMSFAIIGEESQETVDYGLPVRIMESDLADYKREVSRIRKETGRKLREKDPSVQGLSSGERLYQFPKNAKIAPVVTIVLSNAEQWDGPRNLTDMLDLEGLPADLLSYVSGYHLNIVEIPKLTEEDTKRFRTDLKQVLDFLRLLQDKETLNRLLDKDEAFRNMDPDAYELVREYSGSKKLSTYRAKEKEGKRDMRNAFDELVDEKAEERAIERAIEHGERVRDEDICIFIEDKLEDGVAPEVIKERLIRRFHLEEDRADQYLKKYVLDGDTAVTA